MPKLPDKGRPGVADPIRDLVIVGGGVAGLTAGLVAAREGLGVTIFDRMGPGGQLINVDRVENYPGFPAGVAGYELGPALAQQAIDAGVRIDYAEVHSLAPGDGDWRLETDRGPVSATAVIVSAGSTLATLGLAGEEELHGRGISYCATCDAEFFRDQDVAVAGGGDSALDETLVLSPVARRVMLVSRGPLRGARQTADRVRALPNVEIRTGATVTELHGEGALEGITVTTAGGASERLGVSGLFVYTGLVPNISLLEGLVPLDGGGHVQVDSMMASGRPGLFVAGDLRAGSVRLLVSCAGDGATAAVAATRYVRQAMA